MKQSYLKCNHCIGRSCKDYLMKCDVLKTSSSGKIKVKVYGVRNWKDQDHITHIRYVEPNKIVWIENENKS